MTEAQLLVCIWCVNKGKYTMTCSPVDSCVQMMKKRVSLIKKHPQGHTDLKSNWACCQFCLAAQMLSCFSKDLGEHQHLLDKLLHETGNLPACFDQDCLPKLDLNSIAFFLFVLSNNKTNKYSPALVFSMNATKFAILAILEKVLRHKHSFHKTSKEITIQTMVHTATRRGC